MDGLIGVIHPEVGWGPLSCCRHRRGISYDPLALVLVALKSFTCQEVTLRKSSPHAGDIQSYGLDKTL